MSENHFGYWDKDIFAMPVFVLTAQDDISPDALFTHLIATGKLSALLDRLGNIRLFTTDRDDGIKWFAQADSSSISFSVVSDKGIEWKSGEQFCGVKQICYGIGIVEYILKSHEWMLEVTIVAAPDASKYIDIYYKLESKDMSAVKWCFDVPEDSLHVRHHVTKPGHNGVIRIGYDTMPPEITTSVCNDIQCNWAELLRPVKLGTSEEWMERECIWSMGQLLSFRNYDGLLNEHYMNLGGYGWGEFAGRECSEVAVALAKWFPDFAMENLCWVAKTQLSSGRIPRIWDFTPAVDINRQPPFSPDKIEPRPEEFKKLWASDQEIWFVLGCMKFTELQGLDFLDVKIPFWCGDTVSLYEHCRRAFYWVRDVIGTGKHGLIRMWHGDWNDYLDKVGQAGRGESVMNSGMACLAFEKLAKVAAAMKDDELSRDSLQFVEELRAAVSACFVRTHFLRCYADSGSSVGEDSVFLNAQTWAALGSCGTEEQRHDALLTALRECDDPIGLCLMSKPYLQAEAKAVTICDYAPGEGENGGIWPQTVYWFIWALCEAGLRDQAMDVWKKMSLHNHSLRFPKVPFGIFNGPDCYSSHHSKANHGATQTVPLNREGTVPMNPIIAWQAWAMNEILVSDKV